MAQDKENRKSTRHFDLQKGSSRKFELEKDSVEPVVPSKFEELKKELLADGVIDADEVARLRKELYADGIIDKEEAELLFEINDEVSGKANDGSWQTFFVEAISDFLLKDEKSPNVIDKDEGAWLIEKIGNDGKVDSTEKALLVNLQKKAKSMPDGVKNLITSAGIARANLTSNVQQQENGGENPTDGGNGSSSKKWLWIIAIIFIILLTVFLLARNKKESSPAPNVPDTTNVSKDSLNNDSTPAATPMSTNKQESPNSNAQTSSTINNDNASQVSSAGNQSAKPAMTNNSSAGKQADNSIAPAGEKLASFGLGSTACGNTKRLARLARKLRKSGGKVSIYGYADKTGTYQANQIVSQRRADAVKAYLLNHGVKSEQINAVGKGVSVKYPTNAQNRRVEAIVE